MPDHPAVRVASIAEVYDKKIKKPIRGHGGWDTTGGGDPIDLRGENR